MTICCDMAIFFNDNSISLSYPSQGHTVSTITLGTVLAYVKSTFMKPLPSIVFDLARTPSTTPVLMTSF